MNISQTSLWEVDILKRDVDQTFRRDTSIGSELVLPTVPLFINVVEGET